jgi:hypothetical protein
VARPYREAAIVRRTLYSAISAVCGCTACCLFAARLWAAEPVRFAVSQEHGVYQVSLETVLDAPPDAIHNILTDYVHIYRLNPSITESEILPAPDASVVRVRTLINDCVFIFCQDIVRVEDIRELESGELYAQIVPQLSNVKSGAAIWQIRADGDATRLTYDLTLEPGFFIPPLVGTYFVKNKLRQQIMTSLNNIERIAQVRRAKASGAGRRAQGQP